MDASRHCLFALLTLSVQASFAEDSLRISRPTFVMPDAVRFSTGRELRFSDQFEQWRKLYCRPVVCPDVRCGGSCSVYKDSCPSFTGLAVFDLEHGNGQFATSNGCSSQCSDQGSTTSTAAGASTGSPCCH